MQPIDNSDLAWLIIADFLADQNKVTESEELRESINNPDYHESWDRETQCRDGRVGGRGCVGGRLSRNGNRVGISNNDYCTNRVGSISVNVINSVGGCGSEAVGISVI